MAILKSEILARKNPAIRIYFITTEPVIDKLLENWRPGTPVVIKESDLGFDIRFEGPQLIRVKDDLIEFLIEYYGEKGWSVTHGVILGELSLRFI